MKVNLQKYLLDKDNIVSWAIIHLMAKREHELRLPEWKHKYEGGPLDASNLDVVLTIEGVEVDFIEAIEEINRQHNAMVFNEAKNLINERYSGLYDKIRSLENSLDDMLEAEKENLCAS